jgi:hypothetical protein
MPSIVEASVPDEPPVSAEIITTTGIPFNAIRLIRQTQSFHLLNNRRAKIIPARLKDAQNPTKSQVNWKNTSMHTQARYISHFSN